MDTQKATPSFESFVENVIEKIGLNAFNARLKEVEAMKEKTPADIEALRKSYDDMTEALNEMRARLAKRERLPENIHRIGGNGPFREPISRECGETLIRIFKGERAHSAGTDSEGGYLVPEEYAAEVIRLIPTVGLARRLARIVPMGSDTMNFGTLASSMTAYWPAENAAITPSYSSYGQLVLNAKILAGLTYGPESLFDDALVDLAELLVDLFIETLAKEEDRVFLAGDVSGASDPFNGILFNANVVEKVMSTGDSTFSDIDADYLLDLQTTVPDGARDGCIYILSPTVFDKVRKLKDTTGDYIWQRPVDGAPGTIWGKPYELSERMPALSATAVSKSFVVYGNPRRFSFLGDRKTLAVKATDLGGDGTFQKIQQAIRVHERVAFNHYGGALSRLKTAAS